MPDRVRPSARRDPISWPGPVSGVQLQAEGDGPLLRGAVTGPTPAFGSVSCDPPRSAVTLTGSTVSEARHSSTFSCFGVGRGCFSDWGGDANPHLIATECRWHHFHQILKRERKSPVERATSVDKEKAYLDPQQACFFKIFFLKFFCIFF